MFLELSMAFHLSPSHVLPGILVKAVSFSTGECVSNEQPSELCHADSKPSSSLHCKKKKKKIALIISMAINSSKTLLKI